MDLTKITLEQQAEIRRLISKGSRLETWAIKTGLIPNSTYAEFIRQNMIIESPSTKALVKEALALANEFDPVLITGPTGSGKELIAGLLHGKEKTGKFIPVNTTAVVDTLFESELFGHRRGSFTGATEDKNGLVVEANGGTLFLDEIGDMNLSTQAKLLRLIENQQYRRVGDSKLLESSCRIVCATHRNLSELVKNGSFREDLYYRLAVFRLTVLPLKDRVEDYYALALREGLPREQAEFIWNNSALPGNIRQLKNIARYFTVLKKLPEPLDSIGVL